MGVFFIDEHMADEYHLRQTLIGDPADGYSGCPGVGPVSAGRLNLTGSTAWTFVVNAYHKAGKTERDALIQARVARILRSNNYSFSTKEITLWQP